MVRLTALLATERWLGRVYRRAYPARPAILASSIGSGSGERTPESPEQPHRRRRPSYHHTPGGATAGPSHHHCKHEQPPSTPTLGAADTKPHTTAVASHHWRLSAETRSSQGRLWEQ